MGEWGIGNNHLLSITPIDSSQSGTHHKNSVYILKIRTSTRKVKTLPADRQAPNKECCSTCLLTYKKSCRKVKRLPATRQTPGKEWYSISDPKYKTDKQKVKRPPANKGTQPGKLFKLFRKAGHAPEE